MESDRPQFLVCPHCQTENLPDRETCFLCGQTLRPAVGLEHPWAPPTAVAELPPGNFHIAALMLVIALIAVCLGVTIEAPGLGVVLILALIPATIRSLLADRRRKAMGRPMTWPEFLVAFAASIGVVAIIGVCSLVAFVATCFPSGMAFAANGVAGIILAFLIGFAAAGGVGFFLIRRLWPRRD